MRRILPVVLCLLPLLASCRKEADPAPAAAAADSVALPSFEGSWYTAGQSCEDPADFVVRSGLVLVADGVPDTLHATADSLNAPGAELVGGYVLTGDTLRLTVAGVAEPRILVRGLCTPKDPKPFDGVWRSAGKNCDEDANFELDSGLLTRPELDPDTLRVYGDSMRTGGNAYRYQLAGDTLKWWSDAPDAPWVYVRNACKN